MNDADKAWANIRAAMCGVIRVELAARGTLMVSRECADGTYSFAVCAHDAMCVSDGDYCYFGALRIEELDNEDLMLATVRAERRRKACTLGWEARD